MRTRGFTLLETLVALGCASIVLAALYGAVLRTTIADARASARADRTATARSALLAIASELEAARVPTSTGGERLVVGAPAAGGPAWQTLRFATGARGPALPADDLPVVDYRVVAGANGTLGTLVRGETARLATTGATEPAPVVDSVRAFRLRCSDGREWTPGWSSTVLPRAVEIVLEIDDGAGGSQAVATTVTLLAAAGR